MVSVLKEKGFGSVAQALHDGGFLEADSQPLPRQFVSEVSIQMSFACLADSGQVAVQIHETTGRVASPYDNTSEKEASQPWSEQNHRLGGLPRPLFPFVSLFSVFSFCPAFPCFYVLSLLSL